MPANQGKDKGQAEAYLSGSQDDSRPLSLGEDGVGGPQTPPWLLAWAMIEIHCKEGNEIKHGKCLVLSKRLSAGGYNYY